MRIAKKSQPEAVALSIFFPYPGTEAYEMVQRSSLLKKEPSDFLTEGQEVVIASPDFTQRRILLEYRLFWRKVLASDGRWNNAWHHRILAS